MFTSKPKYYLPDFAGCWLLIAVLILGGLLFSSLLVLLFTIMGKNPAEIMHHLTIAYCVQMAPVLLFIVGMGYYYSKNSSAPPVKINNPHFGNFETHRILRKRENLSSESTKSTIGIVIFFLLLASLTIAVGVAIDPITNLIELPDSVKNIYEGVGERTFDTLISTSICAPLAEEYIMRGIMERGLLMRRKKDGTPSNPWSAILWTALFFAIIHMNASQALTAIIMGTLLGWIYYKTHSIWASVFIHFVNNSTSIIFAKIFPLFNTEMGLREIVKEGLGSSAIYWVIVTCAILISALLIYIIWKNVQEQFEASSSD